MDCLNAKQQLELLLKQFNLRIYQSYNKWYIVEVTNIFDYYVKDIIYNELQQTQSHLQILEIKSQHNMKALQRNILILENIII